jgi:hypothetical protein
LPSRSSMVPLCRTHDGSVTSSSSSPFSALSEIDVEAGSDSSSGEAEGMLSPGPQVKSFPSLVNQQQGAGAQGRAQGWQCLLAWVQHLQRVSRRRPIDHCKSHADARTDPKGQAVLAREEGSHGTASSRCDLAQVRWEALLALHTRFECAVQLKKQASSDSKTAFGYATLTSSVAKSGLRGSRYR